MDGECALPVAKNRYEFFFTSISFQKEWNSSRMFCLEESTNYRRIVFVFSGVNSLSLLSGSDCSDLMA
jgi:hypothetical protein